ncbi:MAG: ABC transporter permease subunit [Planctomycetota bacterium]|nr:ABC transporter permease subunit [Planctomycetota bacterium]
MTNQPSRIVRRTPRSVYRRDRTAGVVIRVGGGAVLLTVLGICVYLVSVVLPLFQGGSAEPPAAVPIEHRAPIHGLQLDEYNHGAVVLDREGTLTAYHLETGEVLGRQPIAGEGPAPTAISQWGRDGILALGFADGTVRTGTIRFGSDVRGVRAEEMDIPVGGSRTSREAGAGGFRSIVERVDTGQVRVTTPRIEMSSPVKLKIGAGAVTRIDVFADARQQNLVVLREEGDATYASVRTTRPLGGGAPRTRLKSYSFEIAARESPPDWVFVAGDGAHVYAVWRDGTCQRYAATDPRNEPIVLAETVQLSDAPLTAVTKLIGSLTLLAGNESGRVSAWFPAPDPAVLTPDQMRLVRGHLIRGPGGAVRSIGTSWRDRSIVITDDTGRGLVCHVASEKRIVTLRAEQEIPVVAGAISPKNDALALLLEDGTLVHARYDAGYPEITFKALFAPVHYEGQPQPSFSYQSSAGDDAAEPKLSLTPLIFGTLKATVVAMLFACPLAVFAAIYTSEFLSPRTRRAVKPAIEIMASLPSVVLGFIAAMVVAPIFRDLLPGIMTSMVTVPLTIIFAAGLWTLVPNKVRTGFGRRTQFVLVGLALGAGFGSALLAGPMLERTLFQPTASDRLVLGGSFEAVAPDEVPGWVGVRASMSPDEERRLRQAGLYFRQGGVVRPVERTGAELAALRADLIEQGLDTPSIRRWLNSEIGGPWPGWLMAMIPVGAIFGLVLTARAAATFRERSRGERAHAAEVIIAVGQPVAILVLTVLFAAGLAWALTAMGLDARDSIFGRFTSRNSLIVGVIMGFAIIPIIYSISEDALASVPNSLRAASLGAGASPWQTAIHVVLPVAASGIFSASMIGLGRAVGETMIVLMATGNTPTMDLNIFEGFRTLSANIAVELPEAPKGEALYRVLFLCGLVLFVMTFFINTVAEIVRQHYRKKNALL